MKFTDFDWDRGNRGKNLKHSVEDDEAEEPFFNRYKYRRASSGRYHLFGVTHSGRYLFIVFEKRKDKIRIISARDMTCAERRYYERK